MQGTFNQPIAACSKPTGKAQHLRPNESKDMIWLFDIQFIENTRKLFVSPKFNKFSVDHLPANG
jgi:hypothetical protein